MRTTLAALAFLLSAATAQAATPPADVVASFQDVLLANMKNGPKLACAGRTAAMAKALDADFDLPYIAERVLRRQWKELSADQRKALNDAMRELAIVTYAAEFKEFGGEAFSILDTQALADGTQLVHAKLELKDANPVAFDYVLRDGGSGFRVVNVIADGVSDLAVRSTQYDRAYKAGGYDGLMKLLKSQIDANRKNC
jgi:phospholipid transport system substrate-binding protein